MGDSISYLGLVGSSGSSMTAKSSVDLFGKSLDCLPTNVAFLLFGFEEAAFCSETGLRLIL